MQPKFPEISVQNSMDQFGPTGKVSEKTGPPFEVDHFSWSDGSEFWLNGSLPWGIFGFTICVWVERYFCKFKMASRSWVTTRPWSRLGCSYRAGQIFARSPENVTTFLAFKSWTAWRLNFCTVNRGFDVASHADVLRGSSRVSAPRSWGRKAWRTPKNVCVGG